MNALLPLKLKEIAEATGAKTNKEIPDIDITNICTDSRDVKPGSIFVALCGERFDGHAFVKTAMENGALWAVVQKEGDYGTDNLLFVETTRQAFLDIAGLYRSKFSPKVVAVTGSVGKTTTREMIAAVIKSRYKTLKTENNLNNEVGVPKTILELDESVEAMVLEFGMVNLGEIRELTVPAKPDIAVITCIGTCHIENLGSRENIKKAKFEIVEGLKKGGTLLLNKDNDMLKDVCLPEYNVIYYAVEDTSADITAKEIFEHDGETDFVIVTKEGEYRARIPAIGTHNVLNALAGFGAGVAAGIEPQKCADALASFKNTGMRQKMQICRGVTVVEDCYNANPDSMKAALKTLGAQKLKEGGKRIAVLGDMLELGSVAESSHYEIGKLAAENADMLFCYGELSRLIAAGAWVNGMKTTAFHYESKEELADALRKTASAGDIIWLKASRGMRFEDIAEMFYEET
ncbi:MAG: UDP-N-acetylmuramoyl-tripeptide--D-alanyl-D-alanine ligase [Oscillospiraceae bacterium]|nr:UDP-N-acetylmuramoyl-tripeptide--D-alanyl-D-alanine ligase [Oscillospiraceae bacterium]MBQ3561437.1 UDP-N-acetylmuramoyl-tripeptide--D-alanyl-D-alanine ligase [Oscillospiraceae bacterium]MBQ4118365.1 UDP-N-acetylmuramoyl-tripeptide--D-alanyl-D-alanine ligase [Oscillospiraceae bacterium]